MATPKRTNEKASKEPIDPQQVCVNIKGNDGHIGFGSSHNKTMQKVKSLTQIGSTAYTKKSKSREKVNDKSMTLNQLNHMLHTYKDGEMSHSGGINDADLKGKLDIALTTHI